jgi:signal transduction histidine kinase
LSEPDLQTLISEFLPSSAKLMAGSREEQRLSALNDYGILDSDVEPVFDDIAKLASQICETPIALISLVDRGRQWFKAREGLAVRETPRSMSICQHAMLQPDVFVVEDARLDARFADNPLVTGPPYIRFYAGAPLVSANGMPIGALCVIAPEPRELSEVHRFALITLARQVMAQLELRRALVRVNERERRMRQIANTLDAAVTARTRELKESNEELLREMEDRQRAEASLRQSQKMEAVGQLTGGIAHDFNNLLTGIIGSLQLMQRSIAADSIESLPRLADQAMGSAQRAAALTHRLLAFSRQQTLNPQAIDVNRLVASLADLLRSTVGVAIELDLRFDDSAPIAAVDANQLENALLNLAINARDAMPHGGRLTIEVGTVGEGEEARVALRVGDTGVGMSPDIVTRAFDPFFTTKPIGQGTGLGLSMVYGFAQQSGGDVSIVSTPGSGTIIELLLRMERRNAVPVNPGITIRPPAPAEHGCERLLLVEDEPAVRSVMCDLLRDLGYSVHEASDAPEAMRHLQSGAPIDLMITDVGLPGINGRQLAESARGLRPGLKVLFATGYAEQVGARGRFVEPGMAILTKPFDIDTLSARVRSLLDEPALA